MEKLRLSIGVSVFVFICTNTAFAQGSRDSLLQQAVRGTLKPGTINVASGATILTKTTPFFSGGLLSAAQAAMNAAGKQTGSAEADSVNESRGPDLGLSNGTVGCSGRDSLRLDASPEVRGRPRCLVAG